MNILFYITPKSEVAYLYDTDTVRGAMEKMESHRYAAIPIISKNGGKYLGTLTEGDLLWSIKENNIFVKKREIKKLKKQRNTDNSRVYIKTEQNKKLKTKGDLNNERNDELRS